MSFIVLIIFCCILNVYCKDCYHSITTISGHYNNRNNNNIICSGDLIFNETFDSFNLKTWLHERTLAGGGNWEFQWYTNNRSNSYVEDGILYIKPTLTSDHFNEKFLTTGTIDLNGAFPTDVCTNSAYYGCLRTGNNQHILNPVKSAKISTWESFSYRFGTLEVSAKLPEGDWLWPAIWLRPRYNSYGESIASGEIDIMESRGNKQLLLNNTNIGVYQMGSTLHWGPDWTTNRYLKTHWEHNNKEPLSNDFHKYKFTWTPLYLNFYIDDKLIGSIIPTEGFWKYGDFNSAYNNPWKGASRMAPFDQEFYIIVNLAVGGIGYFPDDAVNPKKKPWSNKSQKSATDFWNGRDDWLPTWNLDKNNNAALQIDYIKVYAL